MNGFGAHLVRIWLVLWLCLGFGASSESLASALVVNVSYVESVCSPVPSSFTSCMAFESYNRGFTFIGAFTSVVSRSMCGN